MTERSDGTMRLPRTIGRRTLLVITAVLALASISCAKGSDERGNALWEARIGRVDEALAKKDLSAAERAWHDAYTAALGSRRWDGMVEVGDAARRIGEVGGTRKAAEARARQVYLTALFRARQQGSLDGVLRTAEAFSALGDREVVDQCIRIAERLAANGHDAQARDRVLALVERLATPNPHSKKEYMP